jgi:hypothetical protein
MKQVDAQRDASLSIVNLVRAKLLFVLACGLCLNESQSDGIPLGSTFRCFFSLYEVSTSRVTGNTFKP